MVLRSGWVRLAAPLPDRMPRRILLLPALWCLRPLWGRAVLGCVYSQRMGTLGGQPEDRHAGLARGKNVEVVGYGQRHTTNVEDAD
jgi:hypothetical protein